MWLPDIFFVNLSGFFAESSPAAFPRIVFMYEIATWGRAWSVPSLPGDSYIVLHIDTMFFVKKRHCKPKANPEHHRQTPSLSGERFSCAAKAADSTAWGEVVWGGLECRGVVSRGVRSNSEHMVGI